MIEISQLLDFMTNDRKARKFCFILGSGCSVENGIPTGWELAKKWFGELPGIYSQQQIDQWKITHGIADNDYGSNYAKIFTYRFAKNPRLGYEAINAEIEKGRLGIGHVVLAQLMLKTGSNVVITTNFDTLVEETLYTFTNARPVICGHESIAKYARPSTDHPLIIKIHRDRFMDPFNLDEEIAVLKPEWLTALNYIFKNFIPIVIGYGGNDGSLMGYLKNTLPCEKIFWCVTSERPLRPEIIDVIKHHNGDTVKIDSFNRLMLRLMPAFKIKGVNQIVAEKAKTLSENYISSLITLTDRITTDGEKGERESLQNVINDYTEDDWWYWELKVRSADSDAGQISIYEDGLKKLPRSSELHYNFGCTLLDNFQDRAILHFKKAIKYNAEYTEAWYSLGLIYQRKKQFTKAIQYYRKATEHSTSFTAAWSGLGYCYHSIGDYKKAIDCYRHILIDFPDRNLTWNNLGFSYKEMGMMDDAIASFKQAIKLNATVPQPYFNLGNIYYGRAENKKAINYYRKTVKADPNFADAYYNMGLAYENLNDIPNARKAFRMAVAIDPTDDNFKKRYDATF